VPYWPTVAAILFAAVVTQLSFRRVVCAALAVQAAAGTALAQTDAGGALRSDSRAPYVHRITLYDHDGGAIDPRNPLAPPYSPKMTCGKCHDYSAISHGWHFNARLSAPDGGPHAPPGRPGEPWIWLDREAHVQMPISGRPWPGAFTPQQAGLTPWQFVKRFGRHLPGGGYGEWSQRELDAMPEAARWNISGALEIDCMFCHAADQRHDPAEAARQIADENLRWAPTASLGLAVVRGQARRLPDDFDPLAPPSPDYPERVLPKVVYDLGRFDGDDRVFFNITRTPPAERCYFCHTQRPVGPAAPPAWLVEGDVHLSAGMTCTDCHRNGIDHNITRGLPAPGPADAGATLTCVGCHLGSDGGASAAAMSGRGGAPHPLHAGIPTIHFERLTCTACHSGPWPADDVANVQTALAHGLGLGSKERRADDAPHIVEPVFAAQPDGVIAPHRMFWPAYWARLAGDGAVAPVPPSEAAAAARQARQKLKAPAGEEPDAELIAEVLRTLGKRKDGGEPVYVANGLLRRLREDGNVSVEAHAAAAPYLWPLAHDVRPAGKSLGVRGCTDCHADGAPFFFGRLAGAWVGTDTVDRYKGRGGGVSADAARLAPVAMHELQGADPSLQRAWGAAFAWRAWMKWVGWISVAAVAAVLLAHGLDGLRGRG
jgi:hypothetical protein